MSGSLIIAIVAAAVISWLAYILSAVMKKEENPDPGPNRRAPLSDEMLETKRLDKWLAAAVVFSGFLAISLPLYFLTEQNRQESFVVAFEEEAVERGHHLIQEFKCESCHGPGFVGGVASYVEKRSDISVSWAAPALNDIFYRYDVDEVRFWLVYGRANTPMPAWGLAGNGPMNDQQIEDLIAYLSSIQIDQAAALAKAEAGVTVELNRLSNAAASMEQSVLAQELLISEIEGAPALLPVAEEFLQRALAALDGAAEGRDTDADGIADAAEIEISAVTAEAAEAGLVFGGSAITQVPLDPANPETSFGVADGQAARTAVSSLNSLATNLRTTVENQPQLLTRAQAGLEYLNEALESERWSVDIDGLAEATFDGNVDDAERAIGLFNAYCARCHTAGHSAGTAFTQEAGSGSLGPALWNGRATVQFLSAEDMIDFIANGSELGKPYGVNGQGRGFMPGFGKVLTQTDLQLIVDYLRGDTLRGY
ncbi:MAG: c-type cytochrome [Acidimicrobiia bacterium]|nr:c-type cytochrome [Acidimicrobiia bacterium]